MADVILTGGGTGGHVYPALAVAEALQDLRPDLDVLYVGATDRIEARVVPAAGLRFEGLPASGLSRDPRLAARALWRLGQGFSKALAIVVRERPAVVLGTGGFASAAMLLAARSGGVRVVLHEQNVAPGKVNRWVGRWAHEILVSLPGSDAWWPGRRVALTGNPIRTEAFRLGREEARRRLAVDAAAPLLLITGGSQGARRINEAAVAMAPRLLAETPWQVLHVAGPDHADSVREALPPEAASRWRVLAYADEMPAAVVACDLVIGRAGATTLAEVLAAGRPMVLVPYPFAGGHQALNAASAVQGGAAILLEDARCDGPTLAHAVLPLLTDPDRLAAMQRASRSLGKPEAALEVARVLLSHVAALRPGTMS